MLQALQSIDEQILFFINGLHSSALDSLMHFASGRLQWLPLYAILLALVIWRFRKKSVLILPVVALLVVFSDQSSQLAKTQLKRERPCHNEMISARLHVPDGCGGQYGFFSSHASNTFALATFLFLLWKNRPGRRWLLLLYFWAVLVCLSRIYLGVHYPFDILAGALNGVFWAWIWIMISRRWIRGFPEGKIQH